MTRIIKSLALLAVLSTGQTWAEVEFQVELPTPREHYRTYDVGKASLELMGKVMNDLDPKTREMVMKFMQSGQGAEALPPVPPEQAVKMIRAMGLDKYKTEMLEVFIHQSQVLEVVPEEYQDSILPILHDALLAFMDGLSEERLAERLMVLSRLPKDTPRGDKILVLASKIPTLQKLGQIVSRVSGIPPDVQEALQTLESGISTMTRDELVDAIKKDVGAETIEKHQIRFADEVLAEASVGAVIRATFVPEGATEPDEIVCKLIKPYVVTGLPQELEVIDRLIALAENNADFYNLQGIPLQDLFEEIKAKLAEELLVTQEQANFRRAYEYYRNDDWVRVPEIYDFSTKNSTFMEYLEGVKITDAFPGDQKQRSIIAKRLMKVMVFESLFSKVPTSIFHGDPHAGNVMHVTEDPQNPYQLGLLDWGLLGKFDREHRLEMVQLTTALRGKKRKKLRKNVGALLRDELPEDPDKRAQIFALADQCLNKEGGVMVIYASLIEEFAKAGYVLDPDLTLYIKSQATLAGIYRELDPSLKGDTFVEGLVSKQVMKEFPKRFLFLPAWNYRGYRSLMSNGDVFSQALP